MESRTADRHVVADREAKRRTEKTNPPSQRTSSSRSTVVTPPEKQKASISNHQIVGNSTPSSENMRYDSPAVLRSMNKSIILPPAVSNENGAKEKNTVALPHPPKTESAAPAIGAGAQDEGNDPAVPINAPNDQLLLALNALTTESNVTATVTPIGEIRLKAKDGRDVTFDVTQLRDFLHEVLSSRDELLRARQLAESAEKKVKLLRAELGQISEMVREDKLTGALNRRGLDEAFIREVARSARRASPLCVALIDIDDFKQVNDTHGHQAGDEALVHLTRVIKETLRPNDVFARYGGEEFLILLPDSGIGEVVSAISRLQRELAKRPFVHGDQSIAITFSAGVALRTPGESQESVIARADSAQYQAKLTGKNRVLAAE